MKIQVRTEDIEKGKPSDCWMCPIAHALFRQTGWKWIVGTEKCWLLAHYADERDVLELPENARRFIIGFDRYHVGASFAFDLDCEALIERAKGEQ